MIAGLIQVSIRKTKRPVCHETKAKELPLLTVSIYWKASSNEPNLADKTKASASSAAPIAASNSHDTLEPAGFLEKIESAAPLATRSLSS